MMLSPAFLAQNSTYIENLMRHRFVYDVSRLLLQRKPPSLVTVLTAEVDNAGVDLVMTFGQITRQIQMKTLAKLSTANPYAISESLSGVVGGCGIKVRRRGYRQIRIRDAAHRNISLKQLVSILFDLRD